MIKFCFHFFCREKPSLLVPKSFGEQAFAEGQRRRERPKGHKIGEGKKGERHWKRPNFGK
jgi:hypothetical protein